MATYKGIKGYKKGTKGIEGDYELGFQIVDYQSLAVRHSIDNKRCVLLSPTASGKSLIIYYLIRYYLPEKALVIVPTLSLVSQMYSDFEAYAKIDDTFVVEESVHKIYGGQEKQTDKPIIISTWQSLYELNKDFFSDFSLVIGDEAHLYKARSLTKILKNLEKSCLIMLTSQYCLKYLELM